MASIEDKAEGAKPEPVKKVVENGVKRWVKAGMSLTEVLKWDSNGDELIFEHEKGSFMALSDTDIAKLHHENRVRYSMSRVLNEKHDPENDALQQRIKVTAANERRKMFEKTVRTTSQSARATKKLQAFVGEGYKHRWVRPDKLEDKIEQGWEVVKPSGDVYSGVAATDGHYETRVKPGETELILMRTTEENARQLRKGLEEAAKRLDVTADRSGQAELKAMGAELVRDGQGGAWQDRT